MANPKTSAPKFDPGLYAQITLNDLVVYSSYYLDRQGLEITSEDLISACFLLFPRKFSLQKYPQWPDSAVVSRRWSDCKRKGYLRGNAVSGFQITARGLKRAEKVEKLLGKVEKTRLRLPKAQAHKSAIPTQTIHPELKTRARKYIRSIEGSEAYRRYRKKLSLNEFDFRSLLLCTMESPQTTLARNLGQFKEYVRIYDRSDLVTFLEFCEGKFSHLLGISQPARKRAQKQKK